MKRQIVNIGILLVIIMIGFTPFDSIRIHAADGIWNSCPNRAGRYYQSVFPAFRHNSIVLLQQGNEKLVQTVETNVDNAIFIGWSPDCRYLVAGLGTIADNQAVVWDLANKKRSGVFAQRASGDVNYLEWDTTAHYAAVHSRFGSYLWNIDTNSQIQLTDNPCFFAQVEFDLNRGQVLASGLYYNYCTVNYPGDEGVTVYDLNTGRPIGFFGNQGRSGPMYFEISPDGKQIKVTSMGGGPFGSTTWDRDTITLIRAESEHVYPGDLQISPDRRYLAIRTPDLYAYELYRGIRIFDLRQPPVWDSRWRFVPLYQIGGEDVTYTWKFTSATMIEIVYRKPAKTRHFDISSGKFLD